MFRCFRSILPLLFLTISAASQSGQRFIVAEEDLANPLTYKELRRPGNHQVTIVRRFADQKEEKLLQIAEATYPTEDQIKKAPNGLAERPTGSKRAWWCNSFDGVRIPYAITKSAVTYYLDVSAEFGKKNPRNSFWTQM